jgi:N-acetyl-gamma-glutamyl-phosphate reductase
LVANPGCYPTAASLALRPLVEAGVVDLQDKIVCNASSGISGAGRRAVESGQVGVPAENFVPYKMLNHRHVPEILEHSQLAATPEKFNFVPHLLPAFRGILEAIYVTVKPGVQARELEEIYQRRYKSEPCLVIYNQGQIPQLQDVQHTNCCAIGVTVNEYRQAVIVSAIDNLVKGAAGQALQNMNIMMGFEETRGLPLDAKNFSRTTVEGHHQQPGQFPIMMPGRVLVKP